MLVSHCLWLWPVAAIPEMRTVIAMNSKLSYLPFLHQIFYKKALWRLVKQWRGAHTWSVGNKNTTLDSCSISDEAICCRLNTVPHYERRSRPPNQIMYTDMWSKADSARAQLERTCQLNIWPLNKLITTGHNAVTGSNFKLHRQYCASFQVLFIFWNIIEEEWSCHCRSHDLAPINL